MPFAALVGLALRAQLAVAGALPEGALPEQESAGPRSVYHVSWPLDGTVAAVAVLGIVIPYSLSKELITPRCPCNPNEVNAFDRGAIGNHNASLDTTSDVTVALSWVAPAVGDAIDVGFSRPFVDDMALFGEVLAVNGALATAAKYITQRPLPRTYAGDPSLLRSPGGYRSFYSGHTSNVMASLTFAAMTLRLRHGEKWWPWLVAAASGTAVGIERVLAGRHFPTDVMVGALAGSAVGIALPLVHARGDLPAGGPSLTPTAHLDGAQLAWSARW